MKIYLKDIDPAKHYTPHLSGAEILRACTWGNDSKACIDGRLFSIFETIRNLSGGTPIKLHSAFRNFIPLGGSKNSSHLRGLAFDIHLTKKQIENLRLNSIGIVESFANEIDLCGLGFYSWGVHVDCDQSLGFSMWQIKGRPEIYFPLRHWGDLLFERSKQTGEGVNIIHDNNGDSVGDENLREFFKKKILLLIFLPFSITLLYFFFTRKK